MVWKLHKSNLGRVNVNMTFHTAKGYCPYVYVNKNQGGTLPFATKKFTPNPYPNAGDYTPIMWAMKCPGRCKTCNRKLLLARNTEPLCREFFIRHGGYWLKAAKECLTSPLYERLSMKTQMIRRFPHINAQRKAGEPFRFPVGFCIVNGRPKRDLFLYIDEKDNKIKEIQVLKRVPPPRHCKIKSTKQGFYKNM